MIAWLLIVGFVSIRNPSYIERAVPEYLYLNEDSCQEKVVRLTQQFSQMAFSARVQNGNEIKAWCMKIELPPITPPTN